MPCFNCDIITPYMRFVTVKGRRVGVCSNACSNTVKGKCGEPWRWLDPELYDAYLVEHPDYEASLEPGIIPKVDQ